MYQRTLIKSASKSLTHNNFRAIYLITAHSQSTQVQEVSKPLKEFINTPKPPRTHKLKKFEFAFPKSFFVGKCDPQVLEYPEVLKLEEIEATNNFAAQIKSDVTVGQSIKKGSLESLKEKLNYFKLNGAVTSMQYDGFNWTETECAIINESASCNGSIYKHLIEQQLCCRILDKFGTPLLKDKYLNPVIRGEKIIAYAFQEGYNVADTSRMSTVALPDGNGGYEITGSKMLVYNASLADNIIVFASTAKTDETGNITQATTAFIVSKDAPGITICPSPTTLGVKDIPVSQVEFFNVRVTQDGIIGGTHEGASVANAMMLDKMEISPVVLAMGKRLLSTVAQHVIDTDIMGIPMAETEAASMRLGKMATALYVLESSAFLMYGNADLYENSDTFLEKTFVKVISSECIQEILHDSLQLLGAAAQVKPEFVFLQQVLQDATFCTVCDETDANLKITVAYHGLQHAGLSVHEEVKKIRNPLMFPSFIMKKLYEGNKKYGGPRGIDLGLTGYLHPTLRQPGEFLEYCISRVFMASEVLLARYGKEILEKHTELEKLADMAIKTYALSATLGRASRAYCIGLSEAQFEMEMAATVALTTRREVTRLMEELDDGPILNGTVKYINIAHRVLYHKGNFTESPVARNF